VGMLRRLWLDQYSLVRAYWGFYLVGFFVASMGAGAISGLFIVFGLPQLGLALAALFVVAYLGAATVGLWRSANRYPGTLW
jgi:hypothetical protein